MRTEKAEIEAKSLAKEVAELESRFMELVGERLKGCKEVGLAYLQAKITNGGPGLRPGSTGGNTRKDTAMLPMFCGDKSTAYRRYHVRRQQ